MSDEMTEQEGVAGVGLLVAAYVDEQGADNALDGLRQAMKSRTFYYEDAAIVRRSAKGKVHIKETGDLSTGKGAGIGALIGGVIGVLGGPAGVALGAGAGAAIGGMAAHGDAGFDNKTLAEIGGALPNGTSALVVTTSQLFIEEMRRQSTHDETVTRAREIAAMINGHLMAREDVLVSLIISEEGVAAAKVVSSPMAVTVFGIATDGEGVVVEGAVATADGVAAFEAVGTFAEDEDGDAVAEIAEEAVAADAEGDVVDEVEVVEVEVDEDSEEAEA